MSTPAPPTAGGERVLFGSDYPYVPIGATAEGLRGVGIGDEALEAIGHENALRLFGGRPDGR